jgi:hypothetical protein
MVVSNCSSAPWAPQSTATDAGKWTVQIPSLETTLTVTGVYQDRPVTAQAYVEQFVYLA